LVDAQTIGVLVTAASVTVAAVYYVMNLQITRRKMVIDNTIFLGNQISQKEFVIQWRQVLIDQTFQSREEWDKKYRNDPEAFSNMYSTLGMLGQLGMCFHEGLVNREMFFKRGYVTWIKYAFLKVKPFISGQRVLYNDPLYGFWAEYLYDEVQKMYPDVVIPQDRLISN